MKTRIRKIVSTILTAAMLSALLVSPASAASLKDGDNREVITGNPGEAVELGGWTIKDEGDSDNYVQMIRGENGDGDIITIADVFSDTDPFNIKTTISGNSNSDRSLIFWGKKHNKKMTLSENDKIILDVDCSDPEMTGRKTIHIPVKCFEKDDPELRDKVVEVRERPGTVCLIDRYEADGDEEEEDKPAWVYKFYNRESRKKVEIGGWTVTDKNVTGDMKSFVDGGDYDDDENSCWAEVDSPLSYGKPVDTTILGDTGSKHLFFSVWGDEKSEWSDEENKYIDYLAARKLKKDDHILIDVTKSADPGFNNVQVYISKAYFPEGADRDYVSGIVKAVYDDDMTCDLYEEEVDDEDRWVFDFEVPTDQEKKADIVSVERKAEGSGTKTERTQVLGDTVKITGEKKGKKQVFSVTGLKTLKGIQKLTVNAGAKFMAEDLKGYDREKVTISFNKADGTTENGTAKDVKKLFKISKKGQVTVKADKTHSSYTLMIPVEECTLCLTVVNVNFDKKGLKDKKITATTGDGSTLSVNLVEFTGKTAGTADSEFLSADWYVDKKTEVKTTDANNPVKSKKGFNVYLSQDYRTITIANPGTIKNGNVKIIAVINGKKYTATVKARVK